MVFALTMVIPSSAIGWVVKSEYCAAQFAIPAPLVPGAPDVPDVPLVPEEPELPLEPDVPDEPDVPELPLEPEIPATCNVVTT